jgi:hypothetical protein
MAAMNSVGLVIELGGTGRCVSQKSRHCVVGSRAPYRW